MKSKHIGIIGITAEGAALCYKTIVSESSKMMGKNQHPEITMHTKSFDQILRMQMEQNWDGVLESVLESIQKVVSVGAQFIVIPANSIHFAYARIAQKSPVPVLSIVDVAVEECRNLGWKKTLVLGVGQTMQLGLFNKPLQDVGIAPIVPDKDEQELISGIIYSEIVPAQVKSQSIQKIIAVIAKYKEQECDGVILGCTELPLVLDETNCPLSFIDTTRLLAVKAVEYASG